MGGYVGDSARRVLHDAAAIRASCLREGLDVRDLLEVRTSELAEELLRGERWSACPRCLPRLVE